MKISESWLREWVDPPASTDELAEQFTMAGLEVGSVESAAPDFEDVVVGEVLEVAQHPNANKLIVCQVNVGDKEPLNIVCGAKNVYAGMKAPTARPGARLPGGIEIRKTKLRGVESRGMLCSETELGLGEDASGIMDLGGLGEPGTSLREHLRLDDAILDFELTPNRGDCLGVAGIAREAGVIHRLEVNVPDIKPVPATIDDTLPVKLEAPDGCPRYAGRIIRNVSKDAKTPVWMQEKLRRCGLRPIVPVVDVTNYVMLELGQPMHGFDLATLEGGIIIRYAGKNESLTMLDGTEVKPGPDVLIIADHGGPRAIAGIMGGENSGVSESTSDVFLESAFFTPSVIMGWGRKLGLQTDASHRFERGVPPGLQETAIERATALLLDIAGGEPGPTVVEESPKHVPVRNLITLRRARLDRVLGVEVPDKDVGEILNRLGLDVAKTGDGWKARPPAFRFDLEIEEDLIEEVGRIYGYDRIPETDSIVGLQFQPVTEARLPLDRARDMLIGRGYQEVITYSFIDPDLQRLFAPDEEPLRLTNPISSDLSVMRTSLFPGLVTVLQQNLARQQDRVRIFESGLRFRTEKKEISQERMLAGLIYGTDVPEQWGTKNREVDFFDVKADVGALLRMTGCEKEFKFTAAMHPALTPGQTAVLERKGNAVGWVGAVHPEISHRLELKETPYVFELLIDSVFAANVPAFEPISKFPAIRRDLAVVVDEAVTTGRLEATVREAAGELLAELRIFDIYRGHGIDPGRKSVALGLILQDFSRTLTMQDADAAVTAVVTRLERDVDAKIRE